MDLNLKLRSNIDSNLVDMAEEELFQILLKQHLSFNKRWDSSRFGSKIISILRVLGILVSVLGTAIGIIFMLPSSCSTSTQTEYFILYNYGFVVLLFSFVSSYVGEMGQKLG
jgi:hypothetical protein